MQEDTRTDWSGSKSWQHQDMATEDELQHQSHSEGARTSVSSTKPTKERPCDACRRRKTRCVKEKGEEKCVLCNFHSQECTYVKEPIARNRKRKALPDDGDATRKGKGNSGNSADLFRTTVGTGIEEYDEYPGESLLKQTLGLQNKHHSHFVGLTEPFSFPRFSLPAGTSQKQTQEGIVTVRKVDDFNAFTIHEDKGTVGYENEQIRLDAIQQAVEPHGQELVDLYFRIVHPSFPILHKDVFVEKYARSYREFSPSLLGAVYLLSTNYWIYSPTLSGKPRPDSTLLWRLAIESFDLTIFRPKLSSVQAGLLLAQWESTDTGVITSGSRGRLTAHLVSLSHTLGLHQDPSDWRIPSWEISLRRRLGWALYMQDKWVALIEGRPPLISDVDWLVPKVEAKDFPEFEEHEEEGSSEVEKGRIVFMQMIELTGILSEILSEIFSLRSHNDIQRSINPLATLLNKIRPLQLRLKDWFTLASEVVSLETTSATKFTSSGYLKLAYLAVEVSIHRRIICQTMSSNLDPNFVLICRGAARQRWLSALNFVESLKAQHLTSFWYFCSAACLSLLVSFGSLLLGSAEPAQRQFYLEKLKEFRWHLRVNGEAGAKFMKAALGSMILDPSETLDPKFIINTAASSPYSELLRSGLSSTQGLSPPTALQYMSLQSIPAPVATTQPDLASTWIANQQLYIPPANTPMQSYGDAVDWTQTGFGPGDPGQYGGDGLS